MSKQTGVEISLSRSLTGLRMLRMGFTWLRMLTNHDPKQSVIVASGMDSIVKTGCEDSVEYIVLSSLGTLCKQLGLAC